MLCFVYIGWIMNHARRHTLIVSTKNGTQWGSRSGMQTKERSTHIVHTGQESYRGVSRQKCANLQTRAALTQSEWVYRSTAESVYILAAPGLQDRSPQSLSRRERERTDLLQERDFPTTMYTFMYLYSLGVCILISLPRTYIHIRTGSLGVPPRLINDAQMMKMNRFCSEPLCSSLCFIYPRCCYYCALAFLCC
jgi:hypothetical protein